VLPLFSVPAHAQEKLWVDDLTPSQIADLENIAKAFNTANKSGTAGPVVPENLLDFVNSGYAYAVAVQIAAKQLGMEVDEFVRSPIGREAYDLMRWQLYSESILFILFALVSLITGISIFIWIWYNTIEYEIRENTIEDKVVKIKIPQLTDNSQEWRFAGTCTLAITFGVSVLFIMNAI
jgi:hypothetical protein